MESNIATFAEELGCDVVAARFRQLADTRCAASHLPAAVIRVARGSFSRGDTHGLLKGPQPEVVSPPGCKGQRLQLAEQPGGTLSCWGIIIKACLPWPCRRTAIQTLMWDNSTSQWRDLILLGPGTTPFSCLLPFSQPHWMATHEELHANVLCLVKGACRLPAHICTRLRSC